LGLPCLLDLRDLGLDGVPRPSALTLVECQVQAHAKRTLPWTWQSTKLMQPNYSIVLPTFT